MKREYQKLPSFPSTKGSIIERLLGQEMFLFEATDGGPRVYKLNSGMAMIWLLCDGTRTLDEIGMEIASCGNRPKNEILLEVLGGVEQLYRLGLLDR